MAYVELILLVMSPVLVLRSSEEFNFVLEETLVSADMVKICEIILLVLGTHVLRCGRDS